MSIRLYVGNLPKEDVDRQELQAVFAEAGDFVSTKVIKDRKTGKCRGFGFVTVDTDEQADEIIDKFNGYMFKETALKIEKALPRTKGKGDEEGGPTSDSDSPASDGPAISSPVISSPASSSGGGSPSSSSGRRGNNKKSRRAPTTTTSSSGGGSDAIQPDPRWAGELAKLKEMLAAQASNP
ncbi:MAG: RNA-binding protein [Aphanothece sp. CMT-3BRIN-NPC111]|jgi:RNA recognition motif-containing protein|nr:RNA-binding protein [Aphanothece sp. CMT-3BRIN-NPC111]